MLIMFKDHVYKQSNRIESVYNVKHFTNIWLTYVVIIPGKGNLSISRTLAPNSIVKPI